MDRLIKCAKCGTTLETKKVIIRYFNHEFRKDLPCCPTCGQAYVSRSLAEGKVREAEMELEDK
ncbi:MAG: hypothetical protein IIZ45_06900 [Firmicutes bacterium]|nr:hypothetical protein [Bacillota bacterium]